MKRETPGSAAERRVRLLPIDNRRAPALLRILRDPYLLRLGFPDDDADPEEILTPAARVWSIEAGEEEAGVVWLDPGPHRPEWHECGAFLHRRGFGAGPRAMLAALLYAIDRLGAQGIYFEVKTSNRRAIELCRGFGLESWDRRSYPDAFEPGGTSENLCFAIDRQVVEAHRELWLGLLETPVEILGSGGEVVYTARRDWRRDGSPAIGD